VSTVSQDSNYITALDLKRDPFSPEPDSLFYYSFDSIEQRLQILDSLVEGADLFVLIMGAAGCGKTTMLNRYLASTASEWRSARIQVDREEAGPDSSEPSSQAGYPVYVLQSSADPIVLVDDAHLLPEKELAFLIQEALVPGSHHKIKRLILFGESELQTAVTNLAASLSAQPPVNKIHLPGLTEEQTADYLRHRLAMAGYKEDLPFDAHDIKAIYKDAGGFPGPINDFARQRLSNHYSNQQEGQHMLQNLTSGSRRMIAWVGVGVVVILLAALWFFSDRQPSSAKTGDQQPQKTVFRQKIAKRPSVKQQPAGPKISTVTAPAASPQPAAPAAVDQSTEAATVKPKAAGQAGGDEAVKMQPEPVPEMKAPPGTSPTPTTIAKAETKPTPVETASADSAKADQPQEKPPAQQILAADTQATQPKPAPAMAGDATREVRREKWLLAQDGSSYTIQIIGVSSEKSLLDFIKRYQLLEKNEIAYYESTFRGKPWFQALYGLYSNGQEARLAANKLPDNIRQAGPWVRKLSDVHKAIGN
jgi:type II secretory pathway predicted ATPase ExeA